jgi:hypothetical protein
MHFTKFKNIAFITAVLITSFWGCRSIRSVAPDAASINNASIALTEVHSKQAEFTWLSTRFSGSVLWDGKTTPIAGTMRIQKDEAIYISVAPILGIEVARAIITPDSVKLLNRLESTYYVGDLRVLSRMFNADIDFYMLQALLTGNDFPHFRTDQFTLNDESVLIQLDAQQRTRISNQGEPIKQALSIDPDIMRIRTNVIEQSNPTRALRADYKKYDNVSGQLLPSDLKLMFADEKDTSNLEMMFTRTTLDVPQNMEFSVPSKYFLIRLTD